MVEDTVGKGEIACYEQFLLFPQCFKRLALQTCKIQGLFGKGLMFGVGLIKVLRYISDSPPRVPSPMIQSASPRKTDMFGNEDLFGGTSPKSTTKSVIEPRSTRADTSDIFSSNAFVDKKDKTQSDNLEDLFASPSRTSAIKSNVNVEQNDDLFNDVGKTVTDSKPKLLTNNDDDNLFSSPALSKSKIKEEKRKEPEKSDEKASERKSKPVIVPEDDDLFSTPALTKAKDKTNSTAKGNPGMEEDIFGDSSLNKKKGQRCLCSY